MHTQLHTTEGMPAWSGGGQRRLFVSMVLAALFIAGGLSLLRLPDVPDWPPVLELVVQIIKQAPSEVAAEDASPSTAAPASAETLRDADDPPPTAGTQDLQDSRPYTDWNAASERAVDSYVDSQLEDYGYVNRDLAERRRRSAGQYQPGTRELPKPIWENVEKDSLGRSVLRSGDCFKVLDDPNVGSRYTQETFGQYLVQCAYIRRPPKNLPWVEDLRERYEYLQDPDG
jgi:hypothetical protein